jgi:hypothetical protein
MRSALPPPSRAIGSTKRTAPTVMRRANPPARESSAEVEDDKSGRRSLM